MKLKHLFISALCLLTACSGHSDQSQRTATSTRLIAETKPTIRLTLLPQGPLKIGKPVLVWAKLNNIRERTIITPDQLETIHTQKFHLLLIDPTLTDYQHVHPQPTSTPGVYLFAYTPKMPGGYRAWADIKPVGGHEQFAMSEELGAYRLGVVNKIESHQAAVSGYSFRLSFDKPPVVGGESIGTILVTDRHGEPVESLEPIMGAFAHITGFYDDFRTIAHIHPMGKPVGEHDRGGPEVMFHFMPVKPCFVKLFAQVEINGKELTVPFGVTVGKDQEQK